jgi:hypothetical protein
MVKLVVVRARTSKQYPLIKQGTLGVESAISDVFGFSAPVHMEMNQYASDGSLVSSKTPVDKLKPGHIYTFRVKNVGGVQKIVRTA